MRKASLGDASAMRHFPDFADFQGFFGGAGGIPVRRAGFRRPGSRKRGCQSAALDFCKRLFIKYNREL